MLKPKNKKNEKIPYKEYQSLKEKDAKRFFKIVPYPWPVLISLLIPLGFFILMIAYYFLIILKLPN